MLIVNPFVNLRKNPTAKEHQASTGTCIMPYPKVRLFFFLFSVFYPSVIKFSENIRLVMGVWDLENSSGYAAINAD